MSRSSCTFAQRKCEKLALLATDRDLIDVHKMYHTLYCSMCRPVGWPLGVFCFLESVCYIQCLGNLAKVRCIVSVWQKSIASCPSWIHPQSSFLPGKLFPWVEWDWSVIALSLTKENKGQCMLFFAFLSLFSALFTSIQCTAFVELGFLHLHLLLSYPLISVSKVCRAFLSQILASVTNNLHLNRYAVLWR